VLLIKKNEWCPLQKLIQPLNSTHCVILQGGVVPHFKTLGNLGFICALQPGISWLILQTSA
jgi:hypothetical protein